MQGGWILVTFIPDAPPAGGKPPGDGPLQLSANLALILSQKGVSMRSVSRQTGIPEATLSGYLHGAEPSKTDHIRKLCRFTGSCMEDLLYGTISVRVAPPEKV